MCLEKIKNKINGITTDSRKVKQGMLFVAINGTNDNGTKYIDTAIKNGAIAIVLEQDKEIVKKKCSVDYLFVKDARDFAAKASSLIYKNKPKYITSVTGTNGKTSVASFYRQMMNKIGFLSSTVGTLGVIVGNKKVEDFHLTTPDSCDLHNIINKNVLKNNIKSMCIEASSHGLYMKRLNYINFNGGAFTNFTRDHLDFHKNMDDYKKSKLKLFSEVLNENSIAVLNINDDFSKEAINICNMRGIKTLKYGIDRGDVKAYNLEENAKGYNLKIAVFDKEYSVKFPLIGKFQIENALCALGLLYSCNVDINKHINLLENLQSVDGRLELISTLNYGNKGYSNIFIDFAHTDNALKTLLLTLKEHVKGRLVLVFGCGGDRDKGKRKLMGAVANKYADIVYLTDDNPRYEKPEEIREEIMEACPNAINVEEGRKEAILRAIKCLKQDDSLVIAGKGHESGQIVKDKVYDFNDKDEVLKIVKSISNK